jgi:hypothetical protein
LISTPSIRQEVESHSTANKNQYLESVTKRGYSLLRKDKHQSFLISMIPSGRVNPSEGAAPASNSIATPASDSITLQDTLYVQIRGGPLPMHPSEGVADNLERHRISNGKRLLHCLRSNQLGVQSACTGPQRLDNSTSLTNQSGHSSNIQCPITQLSVPFPSTGVAPAATVRADSFDGNTRVPTPSIEHDDSTLNDIRPDQLEVIAIAKAQATVSHVLGPYTGISYAMHPCTRFSAAPEMEYDKALKWLGRYLIETRDKGLIFDPKEQSFDCHADASFSGEWDREGALEDPDTARSRTGFVISYANCPIIWTSRLQTQIALSSTECEYVSLSTALREVIPLMTLVREMKEQGFDMQATRPKIHCRAFEDNSGAIEIATVHKTRPRTKHINVAYHHFRSYVNSGDITVHDIDTSLQRADMFTKPVNDTLLQRHRLSIMGW